MHGANLLRVHIHTHALKQDQTTSFSNYRLTLSYDLQQIVLYKSPVTQPVRAKEEKPSLFAIHNCGQLGSMNHIHLDVINITETKCWLVWKVPIQSALVPPLV